MECVWCEEGNTGGDETRVIFYVNGIRATQDKHCNGSCRRSRTRPAR